MRKLQYIIAIILFFTCNTGQAAEPENDSKFRLFRTVLSLIQSEYVEEISTQKILEYAVQGMLSCLDPHSSYLNQKAFAEMKSATKGEFGGLGMELTAEQGLVKVISPYSDAPAAKAGIQAGDYIIMIDDKLVKGMGLGEVSEKLRGEPGTKVNVRVYREGIGALDFPIVREVIKIIPVKSQIIGDNSVGYIKISMFNDKAAALTKKEWEAMKSANPQVLGLVLDLRSNPGGLLEQAKEVANLFLSGGDIVTIKARNTQSDYSFKADATDITHGLPIAVLINSGSASAAEIVAGALQDNKRAIIVGTKSFGKGSVQKIIPLFDNSAIKLTTALYYTPSGTSIQAHGIMPDIIVQEATIKPITKKSFLTISESSLKGHIAQPPHSKNHPTNVIDQSLDSDTNIVNIEESQDFQLLRATDAVKTAALYYNKFISGKRNVK